MGCLAFSKDVKTWVDRRNTLHWLKRYHLARLSGRKHKIKFCALKQACKGCELPHPSRTSLESVLGQMKMCVAAMKKLAKKAPKLRKDMLIRRLVKHVQKKTRIQRRKSDALFSVRQIKTGFALVGNGAQDAPFPPRRWPSSETRADG